MNKCSECGCAVDPTELLQVTLDEWVCIQCVEDNLRETGHKSLSLAAIGSPYEEYLKSPTDPRD